MVSICDPHDLLAGVQSGQGFIRRAGQETGYDILLSSGLKVEPPFIFQLWRHLEIHVAQSPRTQEVLEISA